MGKVTGQFSAFHTKYNDYIFLEHSPNERGTDGNPPRVGVYGGEGFARGVEGLEEKAYEAVDAEFQGVEVEIDWLAMENLGGIFYCLFKGYPPRKEQNRRW